MERHGCALKCSYLGKSLTVTGIPQELWQAPGLLKGIGSMVVKSNPANTPGTGYMLDTFTGRLEGPDPTRWSRIVPGGRAATEIGLGIWRNPQDRESIDAKGMARVCDGILSEAGLEVSLLDINPGMFEPGNREGGQDNGWYNGFGLRDDLLVYPLTEETTFVPLHSTLLLLDEA